jgi:hypothetical protein
LHLSNAIALGMTMQLLQKKSEHITAHMRIAHCT